MTIQPTVPPQLPLQNLSLKRLSPLIEKAHHTLKLFDEVISLVKNPEIIFSLLTTEEALSSLESQKATPSLEGLLYARALKQPRFNKILDYKKELETLSHHIPKIDLSSAYLCKVHRTVQKEGIQEELGQFRTRQNWIGEEGCSIEKAYFYPPSPDRVSKEMHLLKKYLSYKQDDPLIQLAIYFAELLIIHPFMNGNGKVARAIIPVFLYKKKLTSAPLFYLSSYFKKHRLEYFDKLFSISFEKKWIEWIHFFLKGIIEEGSKNIARAKNLLRLHEQFEAVLGSTKQAKVLTQAFFISPILDIRTLSSRKETAQLLQKLQKAGLIIPYKKIKPVMALAGLSKIVR